MINIFVLNAYLAAWTVSKVYYDGCLLLLEMSRYGSNRKGVWIDQKYYCVDCAVEVLDISISDDEESDLEFKLNEDNIRT